METLELTRHEPVLVKEVLHYLDPQPNKLYLDATFGGGGHTKAILTQEQAAAVVAMDWDQQGLDANGPPMEEQFGERLTLCWGNFATADRNLKKIGIEEIDGALADFGTAMYQLKHRPGFSFAHDSPLDMRMSPAHGQVTAAQLLNKASEQKLREIFFEYGQETNSKRIAYAIVTERAKRPFVTTRQLAQLIENLVPRTRGIHPATRVFQALRIFINRELDNIRSFLPAASRIIRPGGNLVVITFHSLEDQIVKHYFRQAEQEGRMKILTPSPISAGPDEIERNPASRSAKLRAAQILQIQL